MNAVRGPPDRCAPAAQGFKPGRIAELRLQAQDLERRAGRGVEHELAVAQPVAEASRERACFRLTAAGGRRRGVREFAGRLIGIRSPNRWSFYM